jgi:hypothetical protein
MLQEVSTGVERVDADCGYADCGSADQNDDFILGVQSQHSTLRVVRFSFLEKCSILLILWEADRSTFSIQKSITKPRF